MVLPECGGECGVIDSELKFVCASTMRLKTGAARGVALRARLRGGAMRIELLWLDDSFAPPSESSRGNLCKSLLSELALW